MTEFSQSSLATEHWPFLLNLLPQSAYLVGGAVRDGLLSRQPAHLDLDFVLPERAVKTARQIASYYKAGFVLLDAERQIARVVFQAPGREATVDFAQMEGGTLEADLQRRDYTINAIAYNPFTAKFIDPLQGQADLARKLLRMVAYKNLQDDPLRLLRAYRQAAQLGFQLEPDTHTALRQLAALLPQMAVERIRTELNYMLNLPQGTAWVQRAWEDGLLSPWFPQANQRFPQLTGLDQAVTRLQETWPQLRIQVTLNLKADLRDTIKMSRLALAKLATLLTHDPEIAELELVKLRYSKIEIRSAVILIKHLAQIQQVPPETMTPSQQYLLFKATGDLFPALVVMAMAQGLIPQAMAELIQRYFTPTDPVAHPVPLVTGKDLMKRLALSPSPQIGELLDAIQLAQVEGKISTAADAIDFAQAILTLPPE
ncbi:MAG: CCA tRNA nucleotidyltransferase [Oscillatoriales cyanobacterium SM2_3_0]|nr:CCA tRNA nucleotidyltransferase [Oscillatoriales cyanobacterium SM2_3_0]